MPGGHLGPCQDPSASTGAFLESVCAAQHSATPPCSRAVGISGMVPSVSLSAARSSFLLVGTAGPPQERFGIAEHPSLCSAVTSGALMMWQGCALALARRQEPFQVSKVFSACSTLPALLACPACRICLLRVCSLQEHLGGLCRCCGAVSPSFPPAAGVCFPVGGAGQPQTVGMAVMVGRCVVTGLSPLSSCSSTPRVASPSCPCAMA